MAIKLMPLGLAKKLNPIAVPHILDCSYLASAEPPPTLDLPRLGGGLARFTHIASSRAMNLEQMYLLNRPESFNFPGLVIAKGETELLPIPVLPIPTFDSISLITEAGVTSENFLIDVAETASDAFDDGVAFIEPRVLSEDFLLAQAKVSRHALDHGLVFPKVEIVDVSGRVSVWNDVTIVSDALNGYTLLHPSEILSLSDGLVIDKPTILKFVNFPEVPEIISPFNLMTRARTVGRDYRSRYEIKEGEKVGSQSILPGIASRCRHGKVRSRCAICSTNRIPSSPASPLAPQPKVVDVFEQLFYILQPPILPASGEPILFPNGKTPYLFQIAGIAWLVERESALLADQMGLGKTIQAIIAMRILFRRGELQRALVACPASMIGTWERELKSWAPELRLLPLPNNRNLRESAWKSHSEAYIVSYETLRNDMEGIVSELGIDRFDLCVLDEAQKIKNPATKVHRATKRLTPRYRWALTGTPIENKLEDIVSIFSFIRPSLFPKRAGYANYQEKMFSIPKLPASSNGTTDEYTDEEVSQTIQPYLLRRTFSDTDLNMPERTDQYHPLELSPAQRKLYDSVEMRRINELRTMGIDAARFHIFQLITKLRLICNSVGNPPDSCKLKFLIDDIESLLQGNDKAIVFSQFPNVTLHKIVPALEEFNPLIYHGSLSRSRRDAMVDSFQGMGENSLMLISYGAGGLGLNLNRANHSYLFDQPWNPAVVDQAVARMIRPGQEKPVFVHWLYARNTIEERILEKLEEKRRLAQQVLHRDEPLDVKRWSDKDLFELFGLEGSIEDDETPTTVIERPDSSKRNDNSIIEPPPVSKTNGKWPDNLSALSPTEFEEAMRDLFYWWKGYLLHTTPASNDGGIDLDGFRKYGSQGRVAIQCKRYSGTVSVGQVREFYGAIAIEGDVAESYMVTTGKFSNRAIRYAQRMNITLIDGIELDQLWSEFLRQAGC